MVVNPIVQPCMYFRPEIKVFYFHCVLSSQHVCVVNVHMLFGLKLY